MRKPETHKTKYKMQFNNKETAFFFVLLTIKYLTIKYCLYILLLGIITDNNGEVLIVIYMYMRAIVNGGRFIYKGGRKFRIYQGKSVLVF